MHIFYDYCVYMKPHYPINSFLKQIMSVLILITHTMFEESCFTYRSLLHFSAKLYHYIYFGLLFYENKLLSVWYA